MSEELKPCPFCGSEDVHMNYDAMRISELRYNAWCDDCGASRDGKPTRQRAIEAWNTRQQ